MTNDNTLVAQLSEDWRQAAIDDADRAMLTYTEKLTLRPWEMVEADVIALRDLGFSDADILDINQASLWDQRSIAYPFS